MFFVSGAPYAKAQVAGVGGGAPEGAGAGTGAAAGASAISVPVNDIIGNAKENIWDAIAIGIARIAINRFAISLATWIRTGGPSEGPSFLSSPEGFFQDIGNQATGVFISELGLSEVLCQPWQFSVKIGLQLQAPYLIKAKCTLLDAEANFELMSKSFMAAGWQGFLDITVKEENNPFSAYLAAQSELAVRVGKKTEEHKFNLVVGQGFFPITKTGGCLEYDKTDLELCVRREPDTVVTPGTYVAETVKWTGLSPIRQAELADELDKSIGIVLGAVILQALNPNQGLANIDTVSYEEANAAFAARASGDVGDNLTTRIDDAQSFIDIKNGSLSLVTGPIYAAYSTLLGTSNAGTIPGESTEDQAVSVETTSGSCLYDLVAVAGDITEVTGRTTAQHINDLSGFNAQEVAIGADITNAESARSTLQGWQSEITNGASSDRILAISDEIANPSFSVYDTGPASGENTTLAEIDIPRVETAVADCQAAS